MDCTSLEEKFKRITSRIETLAQLSELAPSDKQSMLLDELRLDLCELYTEIQKLSSEQDRNDLWDQIIQMFQDMGIIATTAKVLVDIFQS